MARIGLDRIGQDTKGLKKYIIYYRKEQKGQKNLYFPIFSYEKIENDKKKRKGWKRKDRKEKMGKEKQKIMRKV